MTSHGKRWQIAFIAASEKEHKNFLLFELFPVTLCNISFAGNIEIVKKGLP